MASIQRRHEAVRRIERNLVCTWKPLSRFVWMKTGLHGERHEGAFHRIALDDPIRSRLPERRVVAKERCARQRHEWRLGLRIDFRSAGSNTAVGRVAHAADLIFPVGYNDSAHSHFVLGQRAGLVGADERHRTKGLDGGQAADDGVPCRHPLDTYSERHRHDGRKSLWDGRNRHANHGHECFRKRIFPHQIGEREGCRRQRQDRHRELAGKSVHVPDERSRKLLYRPHEFADAPQFRRHAAGNDEAQSLTCRDQRPRVAHRPAIALRGIGGDRLGCFFDRDRLAGQYGLVDSKLAGADQPDIGSDAVACLEHQNIARHEVAGIDRLALAIAKHRRHRGDHSPNGLECFFRFSFLDKPHDGVRDDDAKYHGGIDAVSQEGRKRGRNEQHVDQYIVELDEKSLQRGPSHGWRQTIGAINLEAPRHFRLGQTIRIAHDVGKAILGRHGIPLWGRLISSACGQRHPISLLVD